MRTFDLQTLLAYAAKKNQRWTEFLRVPSLSVGLYRLQSGQAGPQRPHTEDEVYYVISGRARFHAGAEQQGVGPGSLIFVERGADHRFYDVTEDLTVLVFFAPPEGSLAASGVTK